jgi:hypothetical protein
VKVEHRFGRDGRSSVFGSLAALGGSRRAKPDDINTIGLFRGWKARAPEVIVAVPTFAGQGLTRLPLALAKLDTTANVSVLVGDNDANAQEGRSFAKGCKPLSPSPSALVEQRGIAQN